MVVKEPLDVGYHGANHGLHRWTGSQILSLWLSLDTLGQLTDPADLQEQRSVPLVEGRHSVSSFSHHYKYNNIDQQSGFVCEPGLCLYNLFYWVLSKVKSTHITVAVFSIPQLPVLLLWAVVFSAGGRLSRQICLWGLNTFSSSLLSAIMGLRARFTQLLSLVGKTLLSDTIPEHKAKKDSQGQDQAFCVACLPTVYIQRILNADKHAEWICFLKKKKKKSAIFETF